jgi:hypothetical protein
MTAAAGFPIASLIPGGSKAQIHSGAPTAPSAKAIAASAISFRTGLEALVSAGQKNSSELASSEAAKSLLTQAGTDVGSDAKLDLPHETASEAKSAFLPRADQRPQASISSGLSKTDLSTTDPEKSDNATSTQLQAATAARIAITPASKSARSESSEKAKPARDNDKASAQTGATSNQGFALAPVPLSNVNFTAAPAPQHSRAVHASVESSPASSANLTRASYTSSGLSASIGTEPQPQEKDISTGLTAEESTRTSNSVSVAKTQALHTAAASADTTGHSTSQQMDAPAQSLSDDLVLQSQIKAAFEQSASGNAANALPSADAQQIHAASGHSPETRERNSLQHQVAGDAVSQSAAIGSHTALARDVAGTSGPSSERGSATSGSAQTQQAALTSPTARDTFAALDADPGQPATAWTHTSPRQVEAGYQDPALGWVSVRADLTAGGLHASVVPNSPEAAQALGNHLAGLNAYLAEHHGSSITASVAAPEDRSMQQSGTGSGAQPGAHQQNPSSQSSADQLSGQTSISSALNTGIPQLAEPELFTPTHKGRISVLA